MRQEVKTRIGRTIRKDGKNERFHTTVPVRFVEELGWRKGDALLLRTGPEMDVMCLMQTPMLQIGVPVTLCCRGDRYFYITLPVTLVEFFKYSQGDEIVWEKLENLGLLLTFKQT